MEKTALTTNSSSLTTIKKGYKNTEIGVIPKEWEVVELKNISKLITKGTTPKNFTQKGINYIKIESLLGNEINIDKCLFIDENTHNNELKRSILNEGDILFAIAGATIGKATIVPKQIIPANTNQALAIIRLNENENKKFVFIFLKSSIMDKYIVDNIAGGAQPNLNLEQIGNFVFPLPPLPEQTAIATVLSDTDKLLQALQKKIAKKQAIKKGAMQELLKPKKGWVVKPLGKFVNFSNGKAHENHIDANGEFVVINSKFVSTGGKVYKKSTANFSPLKKGDIVMVMSDIPNGKALAKCFLVPKNNKYALNQRICSIRTEEADTKFLLYILNRNKYYLAFDSGTGQTNLKKEDVLNCPIPLPSTKEEQTEIATVLSDMNIEIETLEKQLAKYKQVKQGLMQNLLTGKIRLV